MATDFDRTLSRMESTVDALLDEKRKKKAREHQLALHQAATTRQNARSDRIRNLQNIESAKNQEVINRGLALNADLRRGHDLATLNAGHMTPDQFTLKYGSGPQKEEKPLGLSERDKVRAWNTYIENTGDVDTDFETFKAKNFPAVSERNNSLANIGMKEVEDMETTNYNIGPVPYGGRSFRDEPSINSIAKPKIEGQEGYVNYNGKRTKAIKTDDGTIIDAETGIVLTKEGKPNNTKPIVREDRIEPSEVENPFTARNPSIEIENLTKRYNKIFEGTGRYAGNIYGKTADGRPELILRKQDMNRQSLVNPETGEPVRNPQYDQYMEILNYINQNNS